VTVAAEEDAAGEFVLEVGVGEVAEGDAALGAGGAEAVVLLGGVDVVDVEGAEEGVEPADGAGGAQFLEDEALAPVPPAPPILFGHLPQRSFQSP